MKYDFHTIVIGAGSAGLMTAGILTNLGAKVALIEKNKMGGDCLNTGCVPSKSLLYRVEKGADFSEMMNQIQQTIEKIAPHDSVERFENMGVSVLKGSGKLLDDHRVEVVLNESDGPHRVISGKNIVLATGSKPRIPELDGLQRIPYLTNENLFSMEELPKRFIIWGGGPISMEIGQAFGKLGSEVVIISRGRHLFKRDEPEVDPVMKDILAKEGIRFYLGYEPVKIRETAENQGEKDFNLTLRNRNTGEEKELTGDKFLIALGRISSTEGLGLKNGGVEVNEKGYVKVNKHLQTSTKNIYACGDVVGEYQFTHMGGYEAEIVSKNLLLPIQAKADYSKAVWTTYTKPQVAHSGFTEASAKKGGKLGKPLYKSFEEVDRSIIEEDRKGFVKIILDRKGRIIGGTIVSNEAGEMIGMVSLAINKKMKLSAFQSLIYAYPTKSEIYKSLAVDHLQDSVRPWQRKLLKKWLSR
ncbi:dihydrolipoyl dehydrogenase family protein [Isachenkonia alkalipeptolytica]|uniref:Dihydrolipoamide dehydrogenase n=1 Tax=Isachenkonia alkalipeptolytica TaxID=2565777 RepID=A0AA43XJ86_9CLOT|nr:FAD-dependent oxidoreductase [Isachenkonia alkalipeptolytica]NBG87828.1 dihydrolipoamide dehydrogenase [Isachenkonia alkalipeptolytica]